MPVQCPWKNGIYKEVVIIGNGPSGISLSYLLAGNAPYYTGKSSNAHLHERLLSFDSSSFSSSSNSLLEKDLKILSEGLEGRSNNPLSVLYDALAHPTADSSTSGNSVSLLTWTPHHHEPVSHVVLGSSEFPGGIWNKMSGNIHTLSLSPWMELPNISLASSCARVSFSDVSKYYRDYVVKNKLSSYFVSHVRVTSVTRINFRHCPLKEFKSAFITKDSNETQTTDYVYDVRGHDLYSNEPFHYISPHVVLACGGSDAYNRLSIPGESSQTLTVNTLSDLETFLSSSKVSESFGSLREIVIVGAGLSAANAILLSLSQNHIVHHVFRPNFSSSFLGLSKALYPEYHVIYDYMRGHRTHCNYIPHVNTTIASSSSQGLLLSSGHFIASPLVLALLIGSSPNLEFLEKDILQNLGAIKNKEISKRNLIQIHETTHECIASKGLYALGPLVGDNLVRFIPGGAIGIAAHILAKIGKKKKRKNILI